MKAAPVAAVALGAAIGAVLQTELVLSIAAAWLQFIYCNQPVVVVELADYRKVLVLIAVDCHIWIAFFDRELGAISLENTLKTQAL